MDKLWIILAISSLQGSEYSLKNIADESYQALPIPIVEKGKQSLALVYFRTSPMKPTKPWNIVAPFVVGVISYPDGKMDWHKVSNADFKLKTVEDSDKHPILGPIVRTHVKDVKDWGEANKLYNIAINKVIEKQWLLRKNPSPAEEKKVAKELKDLMEYLEDKPLKAFYKEFGHDLKNWIQKNS